MPLRRKVLLLFVVLALAPAVLLGVGDLLRAARSTRAAAAADLAAAAASIAREVEVGRLGLRLELVRLAESLEAGEALAGAAAGSGFDRLEWRDAAGRLVSEWRGGERAACAGEAVEVSHGTRSGWVLRGEAAAGRLLGGWTGSGAGGVRALLVERGSGRVLADGGCGQGGGWERRPDVMAAEEALTDPAWTVVAAASRAGLAQAERERTDRLALMLFLMAAAAGAFVVLVRHVMRSLEQLTVAAERIGEGDFTPWLPPPGSDEVGRLSHAIATMVARIETMMRQLERNRQLAVVGSMAAKLSHEIRNPLSSLQLNLQSLARDVRRGEMPPDVERVIDVCLGEIQRLEAVLTNVLRLGRPAAAAIEPCDVHALVRECAAVLEPQAAARRIRLELRLDARSGKVETDAAQLKAVLLNLMLNGMQAMGKGGTLCMATGDSVREGVGEVLRIRVRDDGPGVPPRDRARIFEPFYTTKASGTGLGLALAAQTVESLGGWIYLARASELEHGAEFVIELPVVAVRGRLAASAARGLAGVVA